MNGEPQKIVYRTVNGIELTMHIFVTEVGAEGCGIGMLGFHGGGWSTGSPESWYPIAGKLREVGIVSFLAQYRLMPTHKVDFWDILDDAHAAYAWVLEHAHAYGVDPARIGVAGGSAGGHLAAGLFSIPPRAGKLLAPPRFYIGMNPVLDLSEDGWMAGHQLLGDAWKSVSPLHLLGAQRPPPVALFHGTADDVTPITGIRRYRDQVVAMGGICELHEFEGRTHAFFNKSPDFEAIYPQLARFIQRCAG